jgi:hypothetical protein
VSPFAWPSVGVLLFFFLFYISVEEEGGSWFALKRKEQESELVD